MVSTRRLHRSIALAASTAAIFAKSRNHIFRFTSSLLLSKQEAVGDSKRQLRNGIVVNFLDPKTTTLRSINPRIDENEISPPRHYSLKHIMEAIPHFNRELLLFMYSSHTDEFIVAVPHDINTKPDDVKCDLGCVRIKNVGRALIYAFRTKFPDRFPYQNASMQQSTTQQRLFLGTNTMQQQNYPVNHDFMTLVSTGDSPKFNRFCTAVDENHCNSKNFAPILQFGSGYRDGTILPSMIIMPPEPRMHLRCLNDYQQLGEVCEFLLPMKDGSRGLVFGDDVGLTWDSLTPQVVWRGTDFPYIRPLRPQLRAPILDVDVLPKLEAYGHTPDGVIRALRDVENKLLPRWKAVLLTAEAELEALNSGTEPWANMKLSSYAANHAKVVSMVENDYYKQWLDLGLPVVGEEMPLTELAKFKYHVDIGGGGKLRNITHAFISVFIFCANEFDPWLNLHHKVEQRGLAQSRR
ncbi:hypothetical protein ACHAXS_010660 [Conticribra weissflogii]